MNVENIWLFCRCQHPQRVLLLVGLILVAIVVVVGLWVGVDTGKSESSSQAGIPAEAGRDFAKSKKTNGAENSGMGGGGVDKTVTSGKRSPKRLA